MESIRKGNENYTTAKIKWSDNLTFLFLKHCLAEVGKGNRPTTSFRRIGWENIRKGISEDGKCDFPMRAIKNKWNSMRMAWGLWRKLQNMNGVEFFQNGGICMDSEWWRERITENNGYKHYNHGKTPLFQNMQAELFDPISNSGEVRCTPDQRIVVYEEGAGEHEQVNPLLSEGDTPHELSTSETSHGTHESAVGGSASESHGKGKKRKNPEHMSNSDRIVASAERMATYSEIMAKHEAAYTCAKLVEMLNNCSTIPRESPLYYKTLVLFEKRACREIFAVLNDDVARRMYVEAMIGTSTALQTAAQELHSSGSRCDITSPDGHPGMG